jgi:hypothetical protein
MPEKNSTKKSSKELDRFAIQIKPDPKPDTPSYYINYASVAHSDYEFSLAVLRVPTPLTAEQTESARKGEPVLIEPILQLVIPPKLVDGLINALSIQKDIYESENGPIKSGK